MSESAGDKSEEPPTPVEGTSNGTAEEQAPENSTETSPPPAPPPAKPKYRHDWYQTESDVCVSILIKKVKKENVAVEFQEKSVKVRIEVGTDDVYGLSLKLAHPVNVGKCFTKVYGTKVELRMRKCEAVQWGSLEEKQDAPKLKLPSDEVSTTTDTKEAEEPVHKYPSSSHYTRDWDKLVAEVKKEEKEEKPEGDAALNKLFQQIYGDGSDEVKKAMNKSFMESGGTVLSTNWSDIGKGKVERKPPDGMEWKEYEK